MLKLGIEISQATVAKYMVRRRGTPPSQNWRTFLRNQAQGIAAIDMFVVASASFRLLYVMIILAHDRRNIVRTAVTGHPTAAWLSRQVTEAFPWDTAPRYLLRDRDGSYGASFRNRVEAMRITEVITAPRSPWQNAYVERVIGSIRRECLDHIILEKAETPRGMWRSFCPQRTRESRLTPDLPDLASILSVRSKNLARWFVTRGDDDPRFHTAALHFEWHEAGQTKNAAGLHSRARAGRPDLEDPVTRCP